MPRRRVRLGAIVPWGAAILHAALLFYLSSLPAYPEPIQDLFVEGLDKLAHLMAYAVLGGLLWWALRASGAKVSRAAAAAILISLAYAVTDEVHQSFVPNREMSAADGVADVAGAALAAGGLSFLSRRRRRQAGARLAPKRPVVR
ncbi:MAG: VanZ family protein [Planctomycetes bacterium]|nr:VanZ family protein [Planctomycetota bacterium]